MYNRLNVVFIYYSSSYKIPGETASIKQGIQVNASLFLLLGRKSQYNR